MRMPELSLPPPAVQPLLPEGEALGVWRIKAALFRADNGGQWYRARHALDQERQAAVLVLPRTERTAGVMLRYGDLAGELDQIRHPAIAVPGDSGVTGGGQPYLILDWAGGRPLTQARAKLSLRERLQVLVQLCDALRHAHQQGWLLSELDPSLLWIGPGVQLSLMGLGLVRMPDPENPFERGTSLGTSPGYLSPEQREQGAAPSLASEAYGLGALLCMLVDGRLPNELIDADVSLAAAWPALSAAERLSLDALMHKAIAPLPAQRHPSAEALADDLRAWLAGENHSALAMTPMPVPARPIPLQDPAFEPSRREQPVSGQQKPRAGMRLLIASLALATLAAGGWAARKQVFAEREPAAQQQPAPHG
ncbi:hypothetical protein [Pelomonas sp. KK5]|uniref:hypothetical protein n=1 Tax=Pelomonas sp. KK5 TaxID=1855730 RepID=UPI001301D3A9|nr:hypothetical protein [Pelomonas sp. KK5]